MNKFQGPECPNFKLVKDAIVRFATNGPTVLGRRKNRKLMIAIFLGNEPY